MSNPLFVFPASFSPSLTAITTTTTAAAANTPSTADAAAAEDAPPLAAEHIPANQPTNQPIVHCCARCCWEQVATAQVAFSAGSSSKQSSAVIVISIAIDHTADITRRPTQAPIWREADIAHVSRSHEEQQQQVMAGCIVDELALCLSSISSISSSSSLSSLVTNSSGCGRGCGGGVMCVDVPLPRMTMTMMVDGGRSLPESP
ncbi:hypothetical protein PTSG_02069 [Salpingoeca rosetta]|uniref:Uncharacterized protein n=1 Tax=Salpingoeca rosetta (strain ATCC 50818 / BSB-021) TaxID=946362 RepID=F2TZS9_SALR5|nr:uncharacterized protein PTSG_02069 [Salpingoeca rosetta]EGD79103.1 hypothetical protein PTSG_02069 [Salpingoeca rosetta]|eukprot:XP_004998059.1 hypothetical protein PTSG_02069 [Salpingoeca rosetta]